MYKRCGLELDVWILFLIKELLKELHHWACVTSAWTGGTIKLQWRTLTPCLSKQMREKLNENPEYPDVDVSTNNTRKKMMRGDLSAERWSAPQQSVSGGWWRLRYLLRHLLNVSATFKNVPFYHVGSVPAGQPVTRGQLTHTQLIRQTTVVRAVET